MPNLDQALRSTVSRLGPADAAVAEAEELLSRLLGLGRTELYLQRRRELSADQWRRLESWLERRLGGEPIQYITGRAAFRGLDLAVDRSALIPRPETEGLVEAVLEVLRAEQAEWQEPRVLDLGTGSGVIALSVASEWPRARVLAADVAPEALDLARANADRLGLSERVRFVRSDWFEALDPDERFEVVVSNPPYVANGEWERLAPQVRAFEPAHALFSGPTGLEALREIVDLAPAYLVARGLMALELAEMRAHEVEAWLEGGRDWEDVKLLDDLAGRPRVVMARRQSAPAIAPAQWAEER